MPSSARNVRRLPTFTGRRDGVPYTGTDVATLEGRGPVLSRRADYRACVRVGRHAHMAPRTLVRTAAGAGNTRSMSACERPLVFGRMILRRGKAAFSAVLKTLWEAC